MKRFAFAFGLIGASVAGCTSFDSRVAVRGDGLSEYTQVVSESESSPRPAPLATRWQKMMVRIRENCRPDTAGGGGVPQEMAQGPDLAPVAVSGSSQVVAHADGQQVAIHADAHQVAVQAEDQPSAVHAAETIRHQKATRLPSTTSVVQASASQTSSPKTLPSEPNQVVPPGADATRLASTDGPRLPNASSEVATAKFADPGDASPAKVAVRPLNSKRIVLEYEIKDIGPSGVSMVDLWYTRDGRRWEKCPTGAQRTSPYVLEVKEEGLYGITLVAASGIGLKKRPPRPGDVPQVWIDVDTTKPLVRLTGCTVGTGAAADSMSITWRAADKHLGERPITLSYAEAADGPWSTIATGLENTGMYVWKMPTSVPQKLMIRLEGADLAGNVGMTQTVQPVLVDLAKPTVAILGVHSAAN